MQTSDTGISICLVLVDIRFLLVSLKHEKFHIPVKQFLGFPKNVSIFTTSCKFNFCPVMQCISSFNKNSPILTFSICILFPLAIEFNLPYLVRRHALEFFTGLNSSGCVELLQRLQLEITNLRWSNQFD